MNRRQAVNEAKANLADEIAQMLRLRDDPLGFGIMSADVCLDDPRVVQILGQLFYTDGPPSGEPVQLEVYIKEITA